MSAVLARLTICSGSPAGSSVAVVWELSLFRRILLAGNCLPRQLKCPARIEMTSLVSVAKTMWGAVSCIDGSGGAIESVWLLWRLAIIITGMMERRLASTRHRTGKPPFDYLHPAVNTLFWTSLHAFIKLCAEAFPCIERPHDLHGCFECI